MVQVIIRAVLLVIQRVLVPALTGCYAAGAGSTSVSSCVLRIGSTTTRTTGTATSASGWCVPEFCGMPVPERPERERRTEGSQGWAWSGKILSLLTQYAIFLTTTQQIIDLIFVDKNINLCDILN